MEKSALDTHAHTRGVGTATYAAPEQTSSGGASPKSDMYSLGIIMYEMLSKFGTRMHRAKAIQGLKKNPHTCPDFISLRERHPVPCRLVLQLTSPDPSQRPNATELLSAEYFKSWRRKDLRKDELLCLLEERERTIVQKDFRIADLEAQLRDLRQRTTSQSCEFTEPSGVLERQRTPLNCPSSANNASRSGAGASELSGDHCRERSTLERVA